MALEVAVRAGHYTIVELLVDRDANITVQFTVSIVVFACFIMCCILWEHMVWCAINACMCCVILLNYEPKYVVCVVYRGMQF